MTLRSLYETRKKDIILFHEREGNSPPVLTGEDILRRRIAFLGGTGSGKTNNLAAFIESTDEIGFDHFIIDTEGEFVSLKDLRPDRFVVYGTKHSKNSPGIQIKQLEKAVHRHVYEFKSVILNLRQYTMDEQIKIVKFVLELLWNEIDLGNAPPRNRLLDIDEVHEFAPQKNVPDVDILLLIIRVAKQGRKRNFGVALGSQRPASINKDVLTQCDIKVLGRVYYPNDLEVYASLLSRISFWQLEGMIENMGKGDVILQRPPKPGMRGWTLTKMRKRTSIHPSDQNIVAPVRL